MVPLQTRNEKGTLEKLLIARQGPEQPNGADCVSLAYAFGGSNPSLPTTLRKSQLDRSISLPKSPGFAGLSPVFRSFLKQTLSSVRGKYPEWPNGADCKKTAGLCLRRVESILAPDFAEVAQSIEH